jgi:glycosyltransferase involved in cell wall biosynthesis
MTSAGAPKIADKATSRLRLLVVSSDTYPPTRVDVSVLFGEELAGRGHGIDWILQSSDACDKPYIAEWGGGRVWVGATDLGTSLFRRLRKHARGLLNDLRLFERCRSREYDIIEVKDKFVAGLFAVLASRLFKTRFVYWLSWPFPEQYLTQAQDGTAPYPLLYLIRGSIFKFLLYRIIMPSADHVFVQSAQMRKDVAAEGIPLSKLTAVPMGIKLSTFSQNRKAEIQTHIPTGERSILYLGILVKVRRIDFLVRVLALVREKIPDAKLYLVGRGEDPSDEQVLVAEAERLGVLSAVVFTGQLPWVEALEYVRQAEVCVSPFYPIPILNSTSPTKLVEYMAMGRPVVANDHPEQRLLIEESGAGFCVPWNEKAFAGAIVELMKNPARARRMGERGPPYVAKHREYRIIAQSVERELLRIAG